MHRIVFVSSILLAVVAPPQRSGAQTAQPPEGSNWEHVEALSAGTSIHLNAGRSSQSCDLKKVESDTLTCTRGRDFAFPRSSISSIRLAGRSRSAVIGAAVGGAIGIVAVEAAYNRDWTFSFISRGSVAAIVGLPLALAGGFIGHHADFTSSTIYKAR